MNSPSRARNHPQGRRLQDRQPIRHHADDAGLIGALHLAPSWIFEGHDTIIAVDIGGTNIRYGVVETRRKKSTDMSKASVWKSELWRHADDEPSHGGLLPKSNMRVSLPPPPFHTLHVAASRQGVVGRGFGQRRNGLIARRPGQRGRRNEIAAEVRSSRWTARCCRSLRLLPVLVRRNYFLRGVDGKPAFVVPGAHLCPIFGSHLAGRRLPRCGDRGGR